MIEDVLRYINNWYVLPGGVHIGDYSIHDGNIALPFLLDGQYFRIIGSLFNDGVYQYVGSLILNDEDFHGAVWALAIPPSVLQLADDIEAWEAKNGEAALSPYQSESFGGYTYSKRTDSTTGDAVTWEAAFKSRLARLRKL